jgi:small conductance mechanosensitive channel
MENIVARVWEMSTLYGLRIIGAIVVLVIGRWIAGLLRNLVEKVMTKAKVDPTLIAFAKNFTYIAVLTFAVLAALGQLGIQTTSFIAVLGAAGLAVGLALQGSLANFAAGVLMILFRPFKVGDVIEGAGVMGVVEGIQIFTTQLKTPDNKTIIIPNAKLTADNITNYSTKGTRRVDLVVGIGYEDDIDKAKRTIEEILGQDERVLQEPPPVIDVVELAESSVNLAVYPWVESKDYWGVRCDTLETIKKRFDADGISLPNRQLDVHLYEHKE